MITNNKNLFWDCSYANRFSVGIWAEQPPHIGGEFYPKHMVQWTQGAVQGCKNSMRYGMGSMHLGPVEGTK